MFRSNAYEDELAWAGAWLFKATNDSQYKQQAEQFYPGGASWGQSWDDKLASTQVKQLKFIIFLFLF